jgi:hypothetical protein
MSKVFPRHETKYQKVSDNNKCAIPNFQSFATVGHKEWFQLPIQPTAPTTAFSSAPTTIYYDLEPNDCKGIEDLCIRLTVSASGGDVRIVGAPYLFDTITLIADKGSGSNLIKFLPENIIAWCMLTMSEEEQKDWAKLMNFSLSDINSKNQRKYWYNESNYIRDGESRQIYIPLPVNFIKLQSLDFRHVKNPLRFRFECSNDIVLDGSVNNLSLDNIELIVKAHNESQFDMLASLANAKKRHNCYQFLDCERVTFNSKTLTAGNSSEFYLDNFSGKCAFLLVCIKGSTTPSASDNTLFNYLEVGKNGTFDLQSPSGTSILCNGNPINQTVLYHNLMEQIDNKPYTGMYIIPFCEDIRKSLALGNINGFYQLRGHRCKLSIGFDSAPTQEVHTISMDQLGVTGSYRYAFENGGISDQGLDFDATASEIQTAINAMPQLLEKDISVVVNDGIDGVTSQTVTYNSGSGKVSDELGKITIVGNGIPKVNSTSVSTYGDDGFTTGSNYEVSIHCYKWAKFIVDKEGNLKTEDL